MKHKMTKGESIRNHALRRACERFGWSATELCAMRKMIQLGYSVCVERQSNRVSHHEIKFQGKDVTLVYDCKRKLIVTLWPTGESDEV